MVAMHKLSPFGQRGIPLLGGLVSGGGGGGGGTTEAFDYGNDGTGFLASSSAQSAKGNVFIANRAMTITHGRVYADAAQAGEIILASVTGATEEIDTILARKAVTTIVDTFVEAAFDTPVDVVTGGEYAIIFNKTDGVGTDSNGVYYTPIGDDEFILRNSFFRRGWRNTSGNIVATETNDASATDPYAVDFKGTANDVETPASFIINCREYAAITSGGNFEGFPGLGSQADGMGQGFVAPFDMTLKSITEGTDRVAGYRTETSFQIKINGVVTNLVTQAIGVTDFRRTAVSVSISQGDYVEFGYACGNNFSMSIMASFYLERDGATSNGPGIIYFQGGVTAAGEYLTPSGQENGSGANDVALPEAITITGAMYAVPDDTLTSYRNVTVRKNAVDQFTVNLPSGDETAWITGESVAYAQLDKLDAYAAGLESNGTTGHLMLHYTKDGATEQDKALHTLCFTTTDAKNAGDIRSTPVVFNHPGRLVRIHLTTPFGFTGDIEISKNGATATTLAAGFEVNSSSFKIDARALNYSFVAGDKLVFSHTGHGTTGAGLGITLEVELDKSTTIAAPTAPTGTPAIVGTPTTAEEVPSSRAVSGQITIAKPTGIVVGELLWIVAISSEAGGLNNWTTPAGWALVGEEGNTSSDAHIAIFQRIADGTETDLDILYSDDVDGIGCCWMRIEDAAGIESGAGWTIASSGTSVLVPDFDTYNDGALVIAIAAGDGNDVSPYSVNNGFTELVDEAVGFGGNVGVGYTIAYKAMATAGAVGATTFTASVSDGSISAAFAIHPSD